ncbi:MAG: GNAT family N-acetyltransferase [Thermomicrobiales bacterium]|nr:GNAT family N-acetyltransferase [Thermomicrobiales bacterium]
MSAPAPGRSSFRRDRIRTLALEDLPSLRLDPFTDVRAMAATLRAYPGRSVWNPDTLEYVLVSPWRHRPEIANVQSVSAGRHAAELILGASSRCADAGDDLLLLIDLDERRPSGFYARAGLERLEGVITYELKREQAAAHADYRLAYVHADPANPAHLDALLRLDHAAFPWLWWNSAEEFHAYAATPGVDLFLGLEDGNPVSYVGFTTFLGWGHLDRIAVAPAVQQRGLGRDALAFVTASLFGRRAQRIGLSTQQENLRSRRLYEGFGFRRSSIHDYTLYGARLQSPTAAAEDTSTLNDAGSPEGRALSAGGPHGQ